MRHAWQRSAGILLCMQEQAGHDRGAVAGMLPQRGDPSGQAALPVPCRGPRQLERHLQPAGHSACHHPGGTAQDRVGGAGPTVKGDQGGRGKPAQTLALYLMLESVLRAVWMWGASMKLQRASLRSALSGAGDMDARVKKQTNKEEQINRTHQHIFTLQLLAITLIRLIRNWYEGSPFI